MYVCTVVQCQVYNLKFVVGKKGPCTLKRPGEISVTVYSDPYRQQVVVGMYVCTYIGRYNEPCKHVCFQQKKGK